MNSERTARLLLLLAVLLAAASLLPWLDVLPGLHGDEAWVGLRAHRITRGARPTLGMNGYTGPIHQYLCALVMSLWRFDVAGLRLTGVLLNLLGLGLAFAATRRTLGERTASLYCLLLVATPAFSLYGRIATEVTAMSFCLAAGAAACFVRRTRALELTAGALLGVGVWNHLIFVVVPLAFLSVAIVSCKPFGRWLRLLAGLALVLLLRFALNSDTSAFESSGGSLTGALEGLRERASMWLPLFAACLHGDILFMRHVGRVELASVPLVAVLTLACAAASAVAAFRAGATTHRVLVLALLALLGGTLLIAPYTADRYFLLAIYLAPLFPAYWIAHASLGVRSRMLVHALVGLLCVAQSARIAINFHAAHLATGGGVASFQFGQILETSNHFVRSDGLYRSLAATPVKRVYAEFFITKPLAFYDLGRRKLRFDESERAAHELAPRERLVRYSDAADAPTGPHVDRSLTHFEIVAPTADRSR